MGKWWVNGDFGQVLTNCGWVWVGLGWIRGGLGSIWGSSGTFFGPTTIFRDFLAYLGRLLGLRERFWLYFDDFGPGERF